MPPLDESWGPLFVLLGVVATGFFGWLGARAAAKASVKAKEVENAGEIIGEWKALKAEIKAEADEREERLEARIAEEQYKREAFEKKMMEQFNEVILYFAIYVEWARGGAKGSSPYIPEWIYAKIMDARTGTVDHDVG